MKQRRQSAVVFFQRDGLPERSQVLTALEDLGGRYEWLDEHETAHTLALQAKIGDSDVAVSIVGAPLEPEMYEAFLGASGLSRADHDAIARHASHARVVYMDEDSPMEGVDRMALVYRVATRLGRLSGVAVLAPASGVFALGLEPQHIEDMLANEQPPLDLWLAVEKRGDDLAATVGGPYVGLPDVELEGVGILDPEATFQTVMNVMLYLRRIRRELVPGETLHVGQQPFQWLSMRSKDDVIRLRRVDPGDPGAVS